MLVGENTDCSIFLKKHELHRHVLIINDVGKNSCSFLAQKLLIYCSGV